MRRRGQPILHEELRHGAAAEHSLRHSGDELVQATAAPAQRLGDRVRVLDEAGAALALAAEAGLAVDDQRTERPFGGVVRRLDALDVEEGPHRGFGPQDSAAHRRSLIPPAARALIEQPDHLRSALEVRDVFGFLAFRRSISAPCRSTTSRRTRSSAMSVRHDGQSGAGLGSSVTPQPSAPEGTTCPRTPANGYRARGGGFVSVAGGGGVVPGDLRGRPGRYAPRLVMVAS